MDVPPFTIAKSEKSPVARLIIFIICLAIAGSILAGGTCLLQEQIGQDAISHPPTNGKGNCWEVDALTVLWDWFFGIHKCGASQLDGKNYCCDY